MKDIIINCIEGYSASIRPDSKTLSSVIDDYVMKYHDRIFNYNKIESAKLSSIRNSKKFICKHIKYAKDLNLFLVGKSMGGVKTYWVIKRCWKIMKQFKKVVVLFIDAHGTPINEFWRFTPYGKNREIKLKKTWLDKSKIIFLNVYQHNEYPEGAKVKNDCIVQYKLDSKDVNHWNIINNTVTHELIENSFRYF